MPRRLLFLAFGALFGFLLSRAGATTYDFYAGLFLLRDPQLFWVIAVAATVGALSVLGLRRANARALLTRERIDPDGKPWKRGLVLGALMVGLGWGIAGTCPGTSLAMLGEGKLAAGVTMLGIVTGTWCYGAFGHRWFSTASRSSEGSTIRQPSGRRANVS